MACIAGLESAITALTVIEADQVEGRFIGVVEGAVSIGKTSRSASGS